MKELDEVYCDSAANDTLFQLNSVLIEVPFGSAPDTVFRSQACFPINIYRDYVSCFVYVTKIFVQVERIK